MSLQKRNSEKLYIFGDNAGASKNTSLRVQPDTKVIVLVATPGALVAAPGALVAAPGALVGHGYPRDGTEGVLMEAS